VDDDQIAYKLGLSRMPALAHLDYAGFYGRLSRYLAYRGFAYDVTRPTASLLWQEKEQNPK